MTPLGPSDVAALQQKLAGRRVIASLSGGKDSTAMALYLTELGIPFTGVFADTGWEHALTYGYLWDEIQPRFGLQIVRGPLLMADLVRKKGMFPSRVRRFCTQQLKVFPLRDFIRRLDDDVVNAIGIRAGESDARSKLPEWEWNADFDCETWRPLIRWSEPDVIAMHTQYGVPPNPLYLLGAERVGCWPCIQASKAEIRLIADVDPARIDLVRTLEHEVGVVAEARNAADGTTLAERGHMAPSFFMRANTVERDRLGAMMPIDDVVDWSRTSRGGKQRELFALPGEAGCVRWGLCDTPEDVADTSRAKDTELGKP